MISNSLEKFLSTQLLAKHLDSYMQNLAQLKAATQLQLQQAKKQELELQNKIRLLEQLLCQRQKLTEDVQLRLHEQAQKIKMLEGLLVEQQQFSRKEKNDKVPLGRKQCKKCSYIGFEQMVICPNCRAVNWW